MPTIQPFEKPNGWKTQPVPTQAMPRVRRRWNQVHRKERIAHLTSRNPTGVGVSCRFQWPPGWHGIIFFVGDPCNILSPPSFPTVFLGRGENTVPGSLYIWLELLVNVRIYIYAIHIDPIRNSGWVTWNKSHECRVHTNHLRQWQKPDPCFGYIRDEILPIYAGIIS